MSDHNTKSIRKIIKLSSQMKGKDTLENKSIKKIIKLSSHLMKGKDTVKINKEPRNTKQELDKNLTFFSKLVKLNTDVFNELIMKDANELNEFFINVSKTFTPEGDVTISEFITEQLGGSSLSEKNEDICSLCSRPFNTIYTMKENFQKQMVPVLKEKIFCKTCDKYFCADCNIIQHPIRPERLRPSKKGDKKSDKKGDKQVGEKGEHVITEIQLTSQPIITDKTFTNEDIKLKSDEKFTVIIDYFPNISVNVLDLFPNLKKIYSSEMHQNLIEFLDRRFIRFFLKITGNMTIKELTDILKEKLPSSIISIISELDSDENSSILKKYLESQVELINENPLVIFYKSSLLNNQIKNLEINWEDSWSVIEKDKTFREKEQNILEYVKRLQCNNVNSVHMVDKNRAVINFDTVENAETCFQKIMTSSSSNVEVHYKNRLEDYGINLMTQNSFGIINLISKVLTKFDTKTLKDNKTNEQIDLISFPYNQKCIESYKDRPYIENFYTNVIKLNDGDADKFQQIFTLKPFESFQDEAFQNTNWYIPNHYFYKQICRNDKQQKSHKGIYSIDIDFNQQVHKFQIELGIVINEKVGKSESMDLLAFEKILPQIKSLIQNDKVNQIKKINVENLQIELKDGTTNYLPNNPIIKLLQNPVYKQDTKSLFFVTTIDLSKDSNQVTYKQLYKKNITYTSDIKLYKKFLSLQLLFDKSIVNHNIPKLTMLIKSNKNVDKVQKYLVDHIRKFLISESTLNNSLASEIVDSLIENSESNLTLDDLLLAISNITFIFSKDLVNLLDIAKSYYALFSNMNMVKPQTIINYTIEQRLPEIFFNNTIPTTTKNSIRDYLLKFIKNYKLDLYINLLKYLNFDVNANYLDLYYDDKLYVLENLEKNFIDKRNIPNDLYKLCKNNIELLLFNQSYIYYYFKRFGTWFICIFKLDI
jgi:hypothetical protein